MFEYEFKFELERQTLFARVCCTDYNAESVRIKQTARALLAVLLTQPQVGISLYVFILTVLQFKT